MAPAIFIVAAILLFVVFYAVFRFLLAKVPAIAELADILSLVLAALAVYLTFPFIR